MMLACSRQTTGSKVTRLIIWDMRGWRLVGSWRVEDWHCWWCLNEQSAVDCWFASSHQFVSLDQV